MAKDNVGCHISKGALCTSQSLDDMDEDYYDAFLSYNKMARWNVFFNNSDCVKKTINSEYWDVVTALENLDDGDDKFGLYLFLGVAIGAVVIIAVLLLVIYLKKNSSDEEETTGEEPLKVTTSN